MDLTEARKILETRGFIVESSDEFLPEWDPNVEQILNDCYDFEESRSHGPDWAYSKALKRAMERDDSLDYPSSRSEFEEVYHYDIDDPPEDVVNNLYP